MGVGGSPLGAIEPSCVFPAAPGDPLSHGVSGAYLPSVAGSILAITNHHDEALVICSILGLSRRLCR